MLDEQINKSMHMGTRNASEALYTSFLQHTLLLGRRIRGFFAWIIPCNLYESRVNEQSAKKNSPNITKQIAYDLGVIGI